MKELVVLGGGGVDRDDRPICQLALFCIGVVKSWYRLCDYGLDPRVGKGANSSLWGIPPACVLPLVYAVGVLKGQPGPLKLWKKRELWNNLLLLRDSWR